MNLISKTIKSWERHTDYVRLQFTDGSSVEIGGDYSGHIAVEFHPSSDDLAQARAEREKLRESVVNSGQPQ